MADESSRVIVTNEGDVIVVELMDQKILDEGSISQIGEKLYSLAAGAEVPKIVLDFANVGHMSSAALGMLITLHKCVREKGGSMWLCGISETIHEVFVITRLNEVFAICSDRQSALDQATA